MHTQGRHRICGDLRSNSSSPWDDGVVAVLKSVVLVRCDVTLINIEWKRYCGVWQLNFVYYGESEVHELYHKNIIALPSY